MASRDSIFEAAKLKELCDDDETTAPSFSDDSCGDVFDDGWKEDLEDNSWKEIHFLRTVDVSYSKSSIGQSFDEWMGTLKGFRQGPGRVFVLCTSSWADVVKATWRSRSSSWQRLQVARCM